MRRESRILLALSVGLVVKSLDMPALAADSAPQVRTLTSPLECTSTATDGNGMPTTGAFRIEIKETTETYTQVTTTPADPNETWVTLKGPQVTSLSRTLKSAIWRIVDVDSTHIRSFASAWQDGCSAGCAVHLRQHIDAYEIYFVASRLSNGPVELDGEEPGVSNYYPVSEFSRLQVASWIWIAYAHFQEQFTFRDPANPAAIETGSCKKSK